MLFIRQFILLRVWIFFFHLQFKCKRQNCCCSLSHTYPVIEHLPAAVLNFCCDAVDANRHRTQAHNIWACVLIEILFTFHCHFRSYNLLLLLHFSCLYLPSPSIQDVHQTYPSRLMHHCCSIHPWKLLRDERQWHFDAAGQSMPTGRRVKTIRNHPDKCVFNTQHTESKRQGEKMAFRFRLGGNGEKKTIHKKDTPWKSEPAPVLKINSKLEPTAGKKGSGFSSSKITKTTELGEGWEGSPHIHLTAPNCAKRLKGRKQLPPRKKTHRAMCRFYFFAGVFFHSLSLLLSHCNAGCLCIACRVAMALEQKQS